MARKWGDLKSDEPIPQHLVSAYRLESSLRQLVGLAIADPRLQR